MNLCRHFVCWTRLPLVHPNLCSIPECEVSYEDVKQRGLAGFTGAEGPMAPELIGFGGGEHGPAKEVEAFVREKWPESQHWETA